MTERAPTTAGDERWPRIAVAFTLASLAAGYTLMLAFLWPMLLAGLPAFLYCLLIGFLAFVLIGLLAALPAVYLISLAETRGLRSAAYYAAGGAGVALLWLGIFVLLLPVRVSGHEAGRLVLQAAMPGLVGGQVYWWIAGRSAGAPRQPVP